MRAEAVPLAVACLAFASSCSTFYCPPPPPTIQGELTLRSTSASVPDGWPASLPHREQPKEMRYSSTGSITIRYVHEGREVVEVWRPAGSRPVR